DELDVLPALLARRAGYVRVGQLINQGDGRMPGDDRRGIHLLDLDALVLEPDPGHDLEALEQGLGAWPTVDFDIAHDHIGPALEAPVTFLEHPVRLADSRRHTQIQAEPAMVWPAFRCDPGEHLLAGGSVIVS